MSKIKFTTPGAAIDWMRQEPTRRTIVVTNGIERSTLRVSRNQHLEFDCDGEGFSKDDLYLFFLYRDFTGHEQQEGDDQYLKLAGMIRDAANNEIDVPVILGILKETLPAIIAECKR